MLYKVNLRAFKDRGVFALDVNAENEVSHITLARVSWPLTGRIVQVSFKLLEIFNGLDLEVINFHLSTGVKLELELFCFATQQISNVLSAEAHAGSFDQVQSLFICPHYSGYMVKSSCDKSLALLREGK